MRKVAGAYVGDMPVLHTVPVVAGDFPSTSVGFYNAMRPDFPDRGHAMLLRTIDTCEN